MDPFTLLTLLSAGTALVGGALSADATAREGAQNAAEIERSARQAEAARLTSMRQGELAVARRRLEVGQVRSAQAVGYAAAGVDASTGTPADVGAASERLGELDALQLKANAYREAFGFGEQARSLKMKAAQTRRNTDTNIFNALAQGGAGAVSALMPLAKKGA